MIEASALRKRFGDVLAVADVSFTAADGAVTGILGPNGAGKSTALRMLGGLVVPDAGCARIDGIDPRVAPSAARARIGILPDARGLYVRLTARENVRYFGELCGLHGPALERHIDELFRWLELAPLADRRVDGFSQGERMKVAIARAVVHAPQNVVLDEPTNGLDVMSIRSLRTFVRELGARGHAVLFSSHVMSEVATLCDRVVIVAAGRVVANGTPEELRTRAGCDSLEDAFVALTTEPVSDVATELEA
ncbi:MAG: ATP-binding cassette domain-containing protein [Deltaproteobacteria bacterium]|nr:ATP-binding cassette domain-containing protein [Deltaproteobacteria bacterium]